MRVALLQPPDVTVSIARAEQRTLDDLGFETLCSAMAVDGQGDTDAVIADAVRAILPASVVDPAVIRYRHAVLADCCAHPDAVRELYEIATEATQVRRWRVGPRHRPNGKLLLALEPLNELIGCLRRLRTACEGHVGAIESAGLTDLFTVVARELDDEYLDSVSRQLAAMDFEHGLHFSAGLAAGNRIAEVRLHAPIRPQRRWFGLDRRPERAFEAIDDPEAESNPVVQLSNPALMIIADVVSDAADHVQEFFTQLRTQLAFYLGCVALHRRMGAAGIPVCLPVVHRSGVRCTGLRDIGLCLSRQGPVVGNDLDASERALIMITGANNGGKSTLLRALGLAQLMMQAGMFVAADTFEAPIRAGVFTHFAAEEDRTLSHGKLVEELARLGGERSEQPIDTAGLALVPERSGGMSALIDRMSPGSLLLCNEPFASTGARDAARIAAPLLDALRTGGVAVVFVTHLTEFACARYEAAHPGELFLRAERLPDGTRTFRLVPGAPEHGSHAEDIFRRVFGRAPGIGSAAKP